VLLFQISIFLVFIFKKFADYLIHSTISAMYFKFKELSTSLNELAPLQREKIYIGQSKYFMFVSLKKNCEDIYQ